MHSSDASPSPVCDPELEKKSKKACERISENLHIVANEPSLACYRMQEHIRKSLPLIVEKRLEVTHVHKQLQGKCYDLEYSISPSDLCGRSGVGWGRSSAIKSIQDSRQHFLNTQELMKNAMFMKQQLSYEESLRPEKKPPLTMYQRFSGSFDLPSNFLPNMAGLSSSVSASADLKSSPVAARPSSNLRRARASSVSSSPIPVAKVPPQQKLIENTCNQ